MRTAGTDRCTVTAGSSPASLLTSLAAMEYLVHWLGYAPADDTWEPVRVLANAMDDINAYNLLHPVPLAEPPHELADTSEFSSPLPSASQRRTFRRSSGPLPSVAEEPPDDLPPTTEQGPPDSSPEQELALSDSSHAAIHAVKGGERGERAAQGVQGPGEREGAVDG